MPELPITAQFVSESVKELVVVWIAFFDEEAAIRATFRVASRYRSPSGLPV